MVNVTIYIAAPWILYGKWHEVHKPRKSWLEFEPADFHTPLASGCPTAGDPNLGDQKEKRGDGDGNGGGNDDNDNDDKDDDDYDDDDDDDNNI